MSDLKVFTENEHDPGMRYEYLIRAIFDCNSKYCDPFAFAAQDRFNSFCKDEDKVAFFEGQKALATSLAILVYRFPDAGDSTEDLKSLIEKVWNSSKQKQIIEIIDTAIRIGISLGL